MSPHSAGPWIVDDESVHAEVAVHKARWGESDVVVAVPTEYRTDGLITDTDRANLRLIAAAPLMLQALEDLRKELRAHVKLDVRRNFSLMAADAQAGTAIHKARGGA